MTSPQKVRSRRAEVKSQEPGVRSQEEELQSLIGKAYRQGVAAHGDLGLALDDFAAHLKSIITKRLGVDPTQNAAVKLVAGVCAEDLTLLPLALETSISLGPALQALQRPYQKRRAFHLLNPSGRTRPGKQPARASLLSQPPRPAAHRLLRRTRLARWMDCDDHQTSGDQPEPAQVQ